MIIKEYRLLMPLTLEEYHIGQLYMVSKASREETSTASGEGVKILKNEPYVENDHNMPPGQYTVKEFYYRSKIPKFIAMLIPDQAMYLTEYSWNAFPKCLTIYEHKWLGEKFHLSVESMHCEDRGTQKNAVGLSKEDLDRRKVDYINIACKDANNKVESAELDPTVFYSEKAERGKLKPDFFEYHEPIMCAYKVVKLRFKVWGAQTKGEQWGQFYGIRTPFLQYHRKLFCWIDEWYGMTMQDIRAMEAETMEMNKQKLEAAQNKDQATTNGITLPAT